MYEFFFSDPYDALTYMSENDRYLEKRRAEIKAQQEKLEKQAECLEILRDALGDVYAATSISKNTLDRILFDFYKLVRETEKIPDEEDIQRIISEYIDIE